MSPEPKPTATLTELERILVAAASRRYAPRRFRRRYSVPAALFAALAVTGGALAATGVLSGDGPEIERGATANGPYAIRIKPNSPGNHSGPVCLQLQWKDIPPGYRCGYPPSSERPFGLVVADATPVGENPGPVSQRVIYGIVSDEVERVSVLGSEVGETGTQAISRQRLPGRYFSIVVPNEGMIELVGYDASGEEVGRIGSLTEPAQRTEDGIIPAPGDPAVFAPTATPPRDVSYNGRQIKMRRAAQLGLDCAITLEEVRCFD